MDAIAGTIQGGTMKIIIFIIIACTLFVAWSLCIVGASADEQMDEIMEKWKDEKKKGVDTIGAETGRKQYQE